MIVYVACAFVFAAIFCIALGVHALGSSDRRAAIRRRLLELEGLREGLDRTILRDDRLSSIDIFGRVLGQLQFARRLETLLLQAAVPMKVGVFVLMSLSLGIFAGLFSNLLVRHLVLALFVGGSAGFLPLGIVYWKKERRVRMFNEQFPDALDLMVSSLRAGFALSGAVQIVADESPDPVATEFRILFEEQKLGLDIREALLNLGRRMDSTDAALFVTATLIQRDTGGNLAEVLEKIADVIRDRFRILGEIRTFTAVGRLSGVVLALLPPLMAVVITAINPDYMRILTEHPFGSSVITLAVVLQLVGFLMIRKIVNIKI